MATYSSAIKSLELAAIYAEDGALFTAADLAEQASQQFLEVGKERAMALEAIMRRAEKQKRGPAMVLDGRKAAKGG